MAIKLKLEMIIFTVLTAIILSNVEFSQSRSWTLQHPAFIARLDRVILLRSQCNSKKEHTYTTYHADDRSNDKTVLQLSKKKASPAPATKKIQVKMLKYLEGTGHVGEIVMVTPAFFQNKLRPTGYAVMITDEEVMKQKAEAEAQEKEIRAKAEELKERINELSILIRRKAGPDGHLFGGIGPKLIMDELNKSINDDFIKQKSVKIDSISNEDGSGLINGDIKQTGVYKASISLTKETSGTFAIIVESES